MTKVSNQHPEYLAMFDRWKLVRRVQSDNCSEYVTPPYNLQSYIRSKSYDTVRRNCNRYCREGVLIPATRRTREGLVYLVMQKEPLKILPKALEYLIKDCTGSATPLDDFVSDGLAEMNDVGQFIFLVDYPNTADLVNDGEIITKAKADQLGLRPRFYTYAVESLIGWRTGKINNVEQLVQAVLIEYVDTNNVEEFDYKREIQYRVLRLDEDGYSQQVYDKNCQPLREREYVRGHDNKILDVIPLVFCGSKDNTAQKQPIPLEPMAKLNIAHYRDSCAHQNYIRLAGTGTPLIWGDVNREDFAAENPEGIVMGTKGYFLGTTGGGTYLAATDTNAHMMSMKHKEEQMTMCGADLLQASGAAKTAYEVRSNNAAKISPLLRMVNNLEAGVLRGIEFASLFIKTEGLEDAIYDMNKDFIPEGVNVAVMAQELTGLSEKITALPIVRDNWRHKYGLIPEEVTDEELDKLIAATEHKIVPDGLNKALNALDDEDEEFEEDEINND